MEFKYIVLIFQAILFGRDTVIFVSFSIGRQIGIAENLDNLELGIGKRF